MSDLTLADRSPVPTWVATAVMVGALVAGAVLVERALIKAWAEMRKDIHPLAPVAASLQRTKAAYRQRLDSTAEVGQVVRELYRVAPRSR
jgi:hypothetical protein